ncbi:MAG TPA: tyrosine-type recombinase/integrase [Syntrophorhabdus sp.]|nr:tyrosine-type recombinase/integrase [Syntrophorhabdus sp.]
MRQAEEVLRLYLIIMKAGTLQELRKPQKDGIGENTLLEAMKTRIKIKHDSYSAECTYIEWAKRFLRYLEQTKSKGRALFVNQAYIRSYLSYLALQQSVSSSTQNQMCYAHTLQHSFATHLLMNSVNIREILVLLVLKNVEITMIYPRVLRNVANALKAPLDIIFSDKIE